jgi:DNA-binding transcriptional MerR regulator
MKKIIEQEASLNKKLNSISTEITLKWVQFIHIYKYVPFFKRLILILCIWMTIICAIIVYGWYPTKSTNSKPIGEQNSVLHQEIDELQNKIAKMVEEVNARKALEKLHIQSIEELRATIQQQAEEVCPRNFLNLLFHIIRLAKWSRRGIAPNWR